MADYDGHDYYNLYEGPWIDSRPTFFCFGRDIPKGWERRHRDSKSWDWYQNVNHLDTVTPDWVYQVRPHRPEIPSEIVDKAMRAYNKNANGRPAIHRALDAVYDDL